MLCKNKITLFIVSLCFLNSCQNKLDPMIIITTPLGEIKAELYSKNAPVTVNNFLSYLNQDRYDEAHFYRVVHLKNQPENEIKIEVIQGGLGLENHPMRLKSIKHETTNNTGIKHKNGTLSMARLDPGTASSEFFICINDQPELDYGGKRNPDGQGFAAFGKVIEGLEIVKIIQNKKSNNQILNDIIPIKIDVKK